MSMWLKMRHTVYIKKKQPQSKPMIDRKEKSKELPVRL